MGNILLFFAKTLLFAIVLGVFFVGQNIFYEQTLFYYWGNYIVLILYAAYLYFLCRIFQAFLIGSLKPTENILSWLISLIVANTLQYLMLSLIESSLLPILGFLAVILVQTVIVVPSILLLDKLFYYLNPVQKAVIIYGETKKTGEYQSIVERNNKKFEIIQVVSQGESVETIQNYMDESDSVMFMEVEGKKRNTLMEYCFRHNKRVYILPELSDILINTAEITWFSDTPMYLPKSPEPDIGTKFLKRCMDIVISLAALVFLSWLMIITWMVIYLYDREKAIYKQVRVTKGGKLFTLYKFRSMRSDAEDDGIPRLTTRDDNRITPIGRFIRRTRIDELPQLFNVLSGSMSLVGPRPERPEIAEQYEKIYPNFSLRTKVKAGLTGFAQIHGRYNTAPDEKLLMDIMYIENFSIWQDFRLILQTLKVLFKPSSTEGIPENKETALR